MKKGGKFAAIIVLLLVVLFGVGQFFSSGVTAPAQTAQQTPTGSNTNPVPTQVIDYAPVVSTDTPVMKGSCFANSIAAPYRSDAWRCTVGNAISEPCFALPTSTDKLGSLLCGANPAGNDTSSTFVLQLTKGLPKVEMPTGTIPSNWAWLVELNDGTVCSPFTGTRPFDASGDVATYACHSALAGENMIFDDLHASSSVWTAEVGALSTATSTFPPALVASTTVPVYAVWQ
jgi:hypothetical protein